MRSALLGTLLIWTIGCTPPTPAVSPPPSSAPTSSVGATTEVLPAPPADPFALPTDLKREPPPVAPKEELPPPLPPTSQQVRGPGKECISWVQRKGTKPPVCKEQGAARSALDAALEEKDEKRRDEALVSLEGCEGLPAGLIRALRADLAPTECADSIVDPILNKPPKGISASVLQVMAGLALAGRLSRLGGDWPTMEPPYDKQRILEHIKGPTAKWLSAQTFAIEELSKTGAKLHSYAKALVAIEAGLADMRLADSVRSAPTPKEWDGELRDIYQGVLEEALEPRKQRGRDAALLGLGGMASLGVIQDARLSRVRAFLGRLYHGSRIDGLDGLLLPPTFVVNKTVEQRLADRLPTFYASQILDSGAMKDADSLRSWLDRGLPMALRVSLRDAQLSPEQRGLLVQARMELGRKYWRRFDFDEAILLSGNVKDRSEAETLLLATALALRGGPENAADLMLRPPSTSLGRFSVAALDAVASSSSTLAPLAAYNAAYLLGLSPPENATGEFWRGVAKRFEEAAKRLQDSHQRARAEQEAKQAHEIADALQGK